MKRNFNQTIRNLMGKPIPIHEDIPDGEGGMTRITHEMTFKIAAVEALCTDYHDEPPNHSEKLRRFSLAEKIQAEEGEVEIESDDMARIKHVVGKMFNPVIFGRMHQFLEEKK